MHDKALLILTSDILLFLLECLGSYYFSGLSVPNQFLRSTYSVCHGAEIGAEIQGTIMLRRYCPTVGYLRNFSDDAKGGYLGYW
jgi:hypothetical protein